MKNWLLAVAIGLVAVQCRTNCNAQEKAAEKTVKFTDEQKAAADKAGDHRDHLRVFGNREARKLGITFFSVREALKELKASGTIDGTEGNAELAVIVADHISSEEGNNKEFAAAGFDWDALLAFIEKLIALIMKFFVV